MEINKLSLISWNIDGLSEFNLVSRAKCVAHVILSEKPDVVFLQEVSHTSLAVLLEQLDKTYSDVMEWNPERRYYTVMFLLRENITVNSGRLVKLKNTSMDRDVTIAQVTAFDKVKLYLMNSHLESCKESADIRQAQLEQCFRYLTSAPEDHIALFGGDLNLRDQEVGTLPEGVVDLWVANGSPSSEKFTWDAAMNSNISLGGSFRPRCRFDRLYLKFSSSSHSLVPAGFRLIGKNIIRSGLCHPSDHFGILCTFDIKEHETSSP